MMILMMGCSGRTNHFVKWITTKGNISEWPYRIKEKINYFSTNPQSYPHPQPFLNN